MSEKEAPKDRDVGQIVRYLTSTFNTATAALPRPARDKQSLVPNHTYKLQTEFAYRLNEVVRGPRCLLQTNITKCNEYIDEVISGTHNQT